MREVGNPQNGHQQDHGECRHEEGAEFGTFPDHSGDREGDQNIKGKNDEAMGTGLHHVNKVGALEERGQIKGDEENQENPDEARDPSLDGGLKISLSLHD